MKDRNFLKTILPLTNELNAILNRIFECDPSKRITIPELRQLIFQCPMFTTHSVPTPLPSPPCLPVEYRRDAAFNAGYLEYVQPIAQLPPQAVAPLTPAGSPGRTDSNESYHSASSYSDAGSVFSPASSVSSASSTSSFHRITSQPKTAPQLAPLPVVHEPQPQYVSAPSYPWYQPFAAWGANLAQRVSCQPLLAQVAY